MYLLTCVLWKDGLHSDIVMRGCGQVTIVSQVDSTAFSLLADQTNCTYLTKNKKKEDKISPFTFAQSVPEPVTDVPSHVHQRNSST